MSFLFEGIIKVSALYLNDCKEDCSGNAGSVPRDTVTSVSTSSFTSKIALGYQLNECFFSKTSLFCIEAAQFLKAASKREIRPAATIKSPALPACMSYTSKQVAMSPSVSPYLLVLSPVASSPTANVTRSPSLQLNEKHFF